MSLKNMLCTLGKYDIPIIQMQPSFQVDLLDANIAVFGSSMSGKTTFLKTLINILHKQYDHTQEQILILDFGGALFSYQAYPLVSAYFDNSNEEYVKRVFKILENTLKDNVQALSGKNYRESDKPHIHTTFIIDNVNAFLDEPRYMTYQEKLAKLCRDGLSKGITTIVTASNTKGLSSFLDSFKQKIAFELPQDKYVEVFNEKVGLINNQPGRGFANVTVPIKDAPGSFRNNTAYEVQCTRPYLPESQEQAEENADTEEYFLQRLKKKFSFSQNEYKKAAKKYLTFPKVLSWEEYRALLKKEKIQCDTSDGFLSVGLDYVDFKPVEINIHANNVIAIYGKRNFGKTNLLRLLLSQTIQQHPGCRLVMLDDGRNQLSEEKLSLPRADYELVYINGYKEAALQLKDNRIISKKLSPLQQFYLYLNQNYITLDKRFMAGILGLSKELSRDYNQVPDCCESSNPFTIFVIQSKLVYLNPLENRQLINVILPQLSAVAEEQRLAFIFSDVQKISEPEQNQNFNNVISSAFLLDNIAEFAAERGQKTIFGSMDVKMLKEDYAKCETGDGYFYDVEADDLKKLRYIKA